MSEFTHSQFLQIADSIMKSDYETEEKLELIVKLATMERDAILKHEEKKKK